MSQKHHSPGPVPPGNQAHAGPPAKPGDELQPDPGEENPPRDEEQDPKRRLGNFEGKGEHSRQQPGPANDGGVHSQ